MRWIKRFVFISKSVLTCVMIYLLMTKFNDRHLTDLKQLLTYQILYPFPVFPQENFNFLRVIMILGLSFTSFFMTFLFLSDLSNGGRELVRFHSKNSMDYKYKIGKVVLPHYLVEFIVQAVCIVGVALTLPSLSWNLAEVLYLLVSWFVVDWLCFSMIELYSSSSVIVIMALAGEILVRYLLMTYIGWFVFIIVALFLLESYWRERQHVKN